MTEMNIYQKLVEVRKTVPYLQKEAKGHQYQYTGSSQVLSAVRSKMDELGLMLICKVLNHNLIEGQTAKGTKEYMTELDIEFVWVNAEKPEETISCPWYGQGVDTGEKGVGKALTYAEKYFMLKTFNIATDKDDPDSFQEKAESYRKPEPISSKEVGELKTKVLEFAQLRGKTDADVYTALNIQDITKLTSQEAKEIMAKITGWIASAKKELKKESKGA
ncbi:ERF family protein [Peribacillus acanthi]|uniref:ERF family protein n=1 Tax=Peribacillus acanthi TaxID=2171554 RepID=UPI001F0B9894|nr:ERF family protein [Peribacillus acanthi]